jgi:prophage maintenance system killer protein
VSARLSVADLRFVNRVAARRLAGADPPPADGDALAAALDHSAGGTTPVDRAAALAASLLRDGVFASAPLQTALLVVHCALAFDGLILLAPQGVIVGMIRGLARDGDAATFASWLEDRTVPSASGS